MTLFPRARIALRIFEPRYLRLISDCIRNEIYFGQVWISKTAEDSSAALKLGSIGVTAKIVDWYSLPDNMLGVTVEGCDKFHIDHARQRPDQLWEGVVRTIEADVAEPLLARYEKLQRLLEQLLKHPELKKLNLPAVETDEHLANYLAQFLPVEESRRNTFLQIETIADRLAALEVYLAELE